MVKKVSIFWHRRDLRIHDNAGLYQALKSEKNILPLFIFDKEILNDISDRQDLRINFIYQEISKLRKSYESYGSGLLVEAGSPLEVFGNLIEKLEIRSVFTNHDYEPYARQRDEAVRRLFSAHGIPFRSFKDQVIFEKDEIMNNTGEPYKVFTSYMKRWKEKAGILSISSFDTEEFLDNLIKTQPFSMPSMRKIGFQKVDFDFPPAAPDHDIIRHYEENRNYPAREGTTRMGVHLRFGTVSIRDMVRLGYELNDTWLNELIWREFFMMILWHFPHVVNRSFKKQYERILWRNDEKEFKRWCDGSTGYPLVDAGMRELNETGFMHNRVRMVVASFLTKHLLIDWRWGETYFAVKLLDYELSSNNGNWQWAAGTGVDAAPYFRIFNPEKQLKKFDPDMNYVKQWVPEFGTKDYPKPIVEHKYARKRALETFKKALSVKE